MRFSLRSMLISLFGMGCLLYTAGVQGQDATWDNGTADFQWNTTSANWTGAPWTNAHGAIFGTTGAGTINMAGPVSVNSLNFTANGYTINGAGPMTFVPGTSTQTTGVVNVGTAVTASINAPIVVNNGVGLQKIGAGVLELGGPLTFSGSQFPITVNGSRTANLMIGPAPNGISPVGGTVRLLNGSVLASSTNVSIGPGYLDIGSNSVTINNLLFTNQNVSGPWNTTLNANNGVIGSGTLRVLGEIHVIGVTGNNPGNSIAANLDMGGGTQIVRSGVSSSFASGNTIMFNGVVSNGSFVKSVGLTTAGAIGSIDGSSLHGNNTFTGAAIFNSGTNLITGTNATTSVKIAGLGGPGGSQVVLQGANGSVLSASTITATGSGTFVIDNTAANGASGNNTPNIAAAQNNNRISNTATIQLLDGNFTYRGVSSGAASETFGTLNASGGHNVVTMTSASGTINLDAADLTLGSRATMAVLATGTANTLGGTSKLRFSGSTPAADATGIIRRMAGGTGFTPTDFLVHDGTDGLKAFTGYATDFSTPGTNVALTAASTAPTANINALKTTGSFTTTIGTGNTLTVGSGMMLTTGTHTLSGGTLAFGSSPGTFFGSHTINSAVTGTNGLIQATGTLTLAGDLSGLSGTLSNNGTGTTNLNTNTFTGPIELRRGTLVFGVNQTGSGLGAINMGVAANDANLFHGAPTITWNSAIAQIDRNIIVDNGGTNLYGLLPSDSMVATINPGNYSATRTMNGTIQLNSDLSLFGGSAIGTNTASIVFNGAISGNGRFLFRNGRAIFNDWSNSGGFVIGATGNAAHASFLGTGSGSGPITVTGSTTGVIGLLRYNNSNSFGSGEITLRAGTTGTQFDAIASSTINNKINLDNGSSSPVEVSAGAGIVAEWAGQLTGNGLVNKTGAGTWVVSGNANTHTGAINVNAGTLVVNGVVAASANAVTVAAAGAIGGGGVINRNVAVNGLLTPGNSPGKLTINGDLTLGATATTLFEVNGTVPGSGYDQVEVNGLVTLGSSALTLTGTGFAPLTSDLFFVLVNDGVDAINGTFLGLAEGAAVTFNTGTSLWTGQITYLADSTTSSVSGGNDIALFNVAVPEPGMAGLLTLVLAAGSSCIRRRNRNES